ncbi:MAG TPA: hypothetical protein VKU19_12545 [Bryobacteraceae bacterium]|nr:hypothetical protein [Bryobacteraceae bacterium]
MPITRPLQRLEPGVALCTEDRKDAVPQGYFGVSTRDYWTDGNGRVLVNLKDLVETKRHPDLHRLNGCCGLDGCDGPNLVCAKGHEVGTERSDCWMAHAAVLLEDVVWHQLGQE